jgi:hypothetical protein
LCRQDAGFGPRFCFAIQAVRPARVMA